MWDERFNTEEYVYGKEPNDFLVSIREKLPLGRILSLAEGEGRNAVYLARHGFKVVGVDSSSVGLEKAQRLAHENGVEIETVLADLTQFEIKPGVWDGVISIFCHLPAADRKVLFAKVVQGLRPGGSFVLEAYTPKQLEYQTGGPKSVDMLMSLEEVKSELEGMHFLIAHETVREIQEGTLHKGKSSVLQILATKR